MNLSAHATRLNATRLTCPMSRDSRALCNIDAVYSKLQGLGSCELGFRAACTDFAVLLHVLLVTPSPPSSVTPNRYCAGPCEDWSL
jgi:hypothetical protein